MTEFRQEIKDALLNLYAVVEKNGYDARYITMYIFNDEHCFVAGCWNTRKTDKDKHFDMTFDFDEESEVN